MSKHLHQYVVPVAVALSIFLLVLQQTAPCATRPEITEGAREVVRGIEESNIQLAEDSYHLQALEYDRHLRILRSLKTAQNSAGAYARGVMRSYYHERLRELEEQRAGMDFELGKLAAEGASDLVVMARFEKLSEPWRATESSLQKVDALSNADAIKIANSWLERNYQYFLKLSGK